MADSTLGLVRGSKALVMLLSLVVNLANFEDIAEFLPVNGVEVGGVVSFEPVPKLLLLGIEEPFEVFVFIKFGDFEGANGFAIEDGEIDLGAKEVTIFNVQAFFALGNGLSVDQF